MTENTTTPEPRDTSDESARIQLTANQISQDWLDAHGIDEKRNFVHWMCTKRFIPETYDSYMRALAHQGKGERTYTAESIKAELAEYAARVGARTGFTMLEYYRDAFERVGDRPAYAIQAWLARQRRAYGDIA